MTSAMAPTTNEVIRGLAARPGGISWSALVNLFGERLTAEEVGYLQSRAIIAGQREGGGDWVYSVVRVKEVAS